MISNFTINKHWKKVTKIIYYFSYDQISEYYVHNSTHIYRITLGIKESDQFICNALYLSLTVTAVFWMGESVEDDRSVCWLYVLLMEPLVMHTQSTSMGPWEESSNPSWILIQLDCCMKCRSLTYEFRLTQCSTTDILHSPRFMYIHVVLWIQG
jgi:hypothetical protein